MLGNSADWWPDLTSKRSWQDFGGIFGFVPLLPASEVWNLHDVTFPYNAIVSHVAALYEKITGATLTPELPPLLLGGLA